MANHPSAEKRQRQILKQTERNRHVRTTVRHCVRSVRTAISAGDKGAAEKALHVATKALDKAVTKGVFHRKTASRYISRLSHRVSAL